MLAERSSDARAAYSMENIVADIFEYPNPFVSLKIMGPHNVYHRQGRDSARRSELEQARRVSI